MLFILLAFICLTVLLVLLPLKWSNGYGDLNATGVVVLFTTVALVVFSLLGTGTGNRIYNESISLIGDYQEMEETCAAIEAISHAYYPSGELNAPPGTPLNINLDNMKQSTNLSDAIKNCYEKKAALQKKTKVLEFQKTDWIQRNIFWGRFVSQKALNQTKGK